MSPRSAPATRQFRTRAARPRPAPADESPSRAEYRVRTKVWLYPGKGGWHFAILTPRQSHEIKVRFAEDRPGWGAVPVTVRIGKTVWQTSLFPDRKSDCYLFAIKAEVRRQEQIAAGGTINALVQIR